MDSGASGFGGPSAECHGMALDTINVLKLLPFSEFSLIKPHAYTHQAADPKIWKRGGGSERQFISPSSFIANAHDDRPFTRKKAPPQRPLSPPLTARATSQTKHGF